jgi:signal transduction histidine kinase
MSKRLLIVDSEPQNLVLLETQLAALGHQFVRATDALSAIGRFTELKPALVLLDAMMPDGLNLVRQIREHSAAYYVPIVLVSVGSDREIRMRGLRAGADDFLERPIDGPILRTRVRTLLEIKESRDVLRRLNAVLSVRNASLERLRREQRDLMSFIADDFIAPAALVSSSIELARAQRGRPDERRVALDDATDAARVIRGMIEDLLIVSRLEETRFSVRFEPTAMSELLTEVIRECDPRARDKNVRVSEPGPCADTRVTADRALLHRIFASILDQSLRNTPAHGRVGVDLRVGECVEIAVSNSAPEPGSLAGGAAGAVAVMAHEGAILRPKAGLGFYFCRRAIESLGGDLEVTTTPDGPTSVIVRLPASAGAA